CALPILPKYLVKIGGTQQRANFQFPLKLRIPQVLTNPRDAKRGVSPRVKYLVKNRGNSDKEVCFPFSFLQGPKSPEEFTAPPRVRDKDMGHGLVAGFLARRWRDALASCVKSASAEPSASPASSCRAGSVPMCSSTSTA